MFRIVRTPSKLKSFFNPLQNQFRSNQFGYFQTLVLLIAFSRGRRNITALYRHLDSRQSPHRSRFNNVLKAGKFGKNLFRNQTKHTLAIHKSKGLLEYGCVDAGRLDVSGLGKLHVIFSRKKNQPWILGIVTE